MAKFSSNCVFLFSVVVLALITYRTLAQDVGFPIETDEKKDQQNAMDRKPLYIPNRCQENEYLYPGDQKDDWICDCKPGYIFYPDTNMCYLIYTQGPCQTNQFIVLPRNKAIPECFPNPCRRNGTVLFQNQCHRLNEPGPCRLPELGNVVTVNVTTLTIQCQQLAAVMNRFGDEEEVEGEIPYCAKGSRRNINGICVRE